MPLISDHPGIRKLRPSWLYVLRARWIPYNMYGHSTLGLFAWHRSYELYNIWQTLGNISSICLPVYVSGVMKLLVLKQELLMGITAEILLFDQGRNLRRDITVEAVSGHVCLGEQSTMWVTHWRPHSPITEQLPNVPIPQMEGCAWRVRP